MRLPMLMNPTSCQPPGGHHHPDNESKFAFQELVRRGIPHHFRGIAWQLLCTAHESKDKPKYAEYIRTQSACEKVTFCILGFIQST